VNSSLPPLVQDQGLPFDLLLQALTAQLDKAQAAMAIKARVAKLPLTFALKDINIDLRAYVRVVNDEIYVRPAGPGEQDASVLKMAFTTITKPMIEENAVDFAAQTAPSLREALGDAISDEDERRLEQIGVRNVQQLNELRRNAGADVIARLSRLPVNRLQQALLKASAPRVSHIESGGSVEGREAMGHRVTVQAPGMRIGRLPRVRAAGLDVPVVASGDEQFVLAPMAIQMGEDVEIDFGDGPTQRLRLAEGAIGEAVSP
jgi:hypothetical protein